MHAYINCTTITATTTTTSTSIMTNTKAKGIKVKLSGNVYGDIELNQKTTSMWIVKMVYQQYIMNG